MVKTKKVYRLVALALCALIFLSVLAGVSRAAEEEEEEGVIPEHGSWGLGIIGMIIGAIACVYILRTKRMMGGAVGKALIFYTVATVLLAIASVACFFGWVSHLYPEAVSVFIEDQLRLISLVCILIGSYYLYQTAKVK